MLPSLATRDMWPATVGAIIVQVTAALVGRRLLLRDGEPEPAMILLAYLVLPGLAAMVWVWFSSVWSERDGWAGLGFARIGRRRLAQAIALGLLAVPVAMLISTLAAPLLGPSSGPALPLAPGQAWGQPYYILMLLLGAVVLGPLMEEMIFRGLLYGWLRQRLNLWPAAAAAAGLHALLHFDLGALPSLFALFVFLACVYEYSQNLWVPSIIHAMHNFGVLHLP
ncbi:MAG: type II CAAX endopeptidase family protein [Proteobacteria bacterium]|nr:type II CAAX endopeptidase family protein [Pseudomonadota bacterium]